MDLNLVVNAICNSDSTELDVTGSKESFLFLSEKIRSFEPKFVLSLPITPNKFYPNPIETFICQYIDFSNGLINLSLEKKALAVEGDKLALSNFSETLVNLAKSQSGTHFHIEYFEGNQILSKTTISLVLVLSD